MDLVPEESSADLQKDKVTSGFSKKVPITITGIILLILLAAGTAYLYKSDLTLIISNQDIFNKTKPPTPAPASTSGTGIRKSYGTEGFNNCQFQKGKDKLITLAEPQTDGTIYVGMTGNIVVETVDNQVDIALIALDGTQGYQFSLPKDKLVVLEKPTDQKTLPASSLKSSLQVKAFGRCNPKAVGNKLSVDQINIIADLTKLGQ